MYIINARQSTVIYSFRIPYVYFTDGYNFIHDLSKFIESWLQGKANNSEIGLTSSKPLSLHITPQYYYCIASNLYLL